MKNTKLFGKCCRIAVIAAGLAWTPPGHAHGRHTHGGQEPPEQATEEMRANDDDTPAMPEKNLITIASAYDLQVAPLFQGACMDCHSSDTQYPWYTYLPGVRQFIQSDIRNAREHLDLSNGYPFQSHASPVEDLLAIEKNLQDGSMPPLRYRLMHKAARLDSNEKAIIVGWSRRSRELLCGTPSDGAQLCL